MLRRLRGPATQIKTAVSAAKGQPVKSKSTVSFKEEVERLDRMPEGELSRYDWSFSDEVPSRIRSKK